MKKLLFKKGKAASRRQPELPAKSVAANRRALSIHDVLLARQLIAPFVRRTPLIPARNLLYDIKGARNLFLKLENLQVTGSFKARGALTRVLSLPKSDLKNGVITASGGNHGIAVAYAAMQAGTHATIYVPESINPAKRHNMHEFGGVTVTGGTIFHEALLNAREESKIQNIPFIHTFGDRGVIAGQGTVALEILEDLPDVDVLVVAIGGGGLIGGMGLAAHGINKKIRIIGVEPTGAPTLYQSLRQDKLVKLSSVNTRAGTLSMSQTTRTNFEIVRKHVEKIVLVSDEEMKQAAEWLWFEMGIAAELAGAAAIAALQTGKVKVRAHEKVCALVCGSGLDGVGS
ncbi:MAG: pyridoxal-phosphate dependent enzyme [Alphaproteobacteria bacterium]|nr:MAG: pyridoxal-phosphate dependent enzyme [Alphaproteobacteria bacterium]